MSADDIVAWDVYEQRIYGAPGETRHRVLWVEDYRLDDGSTPDLDWMLEAARKGGVDAGARTIYVRPLVYGDGGGHAMSADDRLREIAERCGWADEVLQDVLTVLATAEAEGRP